MILECNIARDMWHRTSLIINDIESKDIILGRPDSKAINEAISIISYTIYKYFLQCNDTKKNRSLTDFLIFAKSELRYRAELYSLLHSMETHSILSDVSNTIFT